MGGERVAALGEAEHAQELLDARVGLLPSQAVDLGSEKEMLSDVTQPKVSAILKGRFRGISEHRLLDCLTRLGRDVHIVVKPAPRSRSNGRLTLSVA